MTTQSRNSRGESAIEVRTTEQQHLSVSEVTSDRAGAGSPFGDDLSFPLPVESLTYQHPDTH